MNAAVAATAAKWQRKGRNDLFDVFFLSGSFFCLFGSPNDEITQRERARASVPCVFCTHPVRAGADNVDTGVALYVGTAVDIATRAQGCARACRVLICHWGTVFAKHMTYVYLARTQQILMDGIETTNS